MGCGDKNSDHTGEQKCRSRWGVGFLQSDQFYSAFVSATLVSRSQREKGSGIENVYQIDMLLLALEGGLTLCRCWGQVSLKIRKLIAKLIRESVHIFRVKAT